MAKWNVKIGLPKSLYTPKKKTEMASLCEKWCNLVIIELLFFYGVPASTLFVNRWSKNSLYYIHYIHRC